MTETMVYAIVGAIWYLVAEAMAATVMGIGFGLWANRKAGPFWEYTLGESMSVYYWRLWDFIEHRRVAYTILLSLIWPIGLPAIFTIMANALNKTMKVYGY